MPSGHLNLTDREVEHLLSKLEIKYFASRDEQEVAGYAEVMETAFQAFSDIPTTANHLKQLHRDLLRYSNKDEREKNALAVLPELAVKILDYVRDHGRIMTRDMIRETGASTNTLKATFGSLVKRGFWSATAAGTRYGTGSHNRMWRYHQKIQPYTLLLQTLSQFLIVCLTKREIKVGKSNIIL